MCVETVNDRWDGSVVQLEHKRTVPIVIFVAEAKK